MLCLFERPPVGRPGSARDDVADSVPWCPRVSRRVSDDAETSDATLFVCVTCKAGDDRPGQALFDALAERLRDEPGVSLRAVECLSVCKRPCTVALSAAGKWTYVVGDLDQASHLDDIVAAARRFAQTADGLVPWRERPIPFRKGVISRTPPLLPA